MSVGWDVKWCPVSRITTPWHAKDFDEEGFQEPPGKLQNFKIGHIKLLVAAVTWLKYCRYGVNRLPINQYSLRVNIEHGSIFEPSSVTIARLDGHRVVFLRQRFENVFF